MIVVRHLLAILLCPFLAAVVVPYWLLTSWANIDTRWGNVSSWEWLPRCVGVGLLAGGVVLFGWCVRLFAQIGQGTLAPWDPTRKLVAVGPYRYVRNPMISGAFSMLLGQALIWGSWVVGVWALLFFAVNHTYFILSEEPGLERRFGDSFRTYKANVPRWIPRSKPWEG